MIKYLTIILILLSALQLNSSPYKLSTVTDSLLIGTGVVLSASSSYLMGKVEPLTDKEIASLSKNNINKFDRSAADNWSPNGDKASTVILISAMISPAAFSLSDTMRNDFTVLGVMYAESLLITSGLNMTTKNITQRKRPFLYNSNVPHKEKKNKDAVFSFYSGHTAITFNSAVFASTVFSDYYPQSQWRYAVWGASLLAASATGYLRYHAGKHYPTDIIVGAVIGSITGWGIPALHRNKDDNISIKMAVGEESMIAVEFYF